MNWTEQASVFLKEHISEFQRFARKNKKLASNFYVPIAILEFLKCNYLI